PTEGAHGLLLRAHAAAIDPSRSPSSARHRSRELLERALAIDPGALKAAHNLALLDLQDGRSREAVERLEARAAQPPGWQWLGFFAQARAARPLSAHPEPAAP